MKPSDFGTPHFGTVEFDQSLGIHWYRPNPLPDELPLDDETMIALSRADAAVGRLDGLAQLLSKLANPALIASPYAAREAVASSRIEGTHATLAEVYETEAGKARAYVEDVKTIRAYTTALNTGLQAVESAPLDLETLLDVHRALMEDQTRGEHAGLWRDQAVWVGAPTGGPETATFVPPLAEHLPRLLDSWAEWHADPPRLPLLIRVALLHYQFLTIHPFVDGNGRVGRMLIQMILEEEHALSSPLLYVSAYFSAHRREYYDRLQAVRQHGEIQQWLQFFLTAVYVQADDGVKRAQELIELREHYRSELSGTRSRAAEVVDMLFINPVISARRVRNELGMSNQGALNLIHTLEQLEILMQVGTSGRGGTHFWISPRILDMFDDESPNESGEPL
jgi:Fic family protein